MPKTNLLFFLNSYSDQCQTTTPALNQFKWTREINGIPYTFENSQQIQVPAGITTLNIVPYAFSLILVSSTGTTVATTNALTITGTTTGIAPGQLIVGAGIPVGTTVLTIIGTAVTMSNAATASGSPSLSFYEPASFVYMESDQQVSVIYNSGSPMALNPFQINGVTIPGVFFLNGPCYSVTLANPGSVTANVFFATMG